MSVIGYIVIGIIVLVFLFPLIKKPKESDTRDYDGEDVWGNRNCPFLNDERLMNEHNFNPDIWYNKNFCSVSDYGGEYEVVNRMTRTVSNTNNFYSCCMNGGIGCPIFEQYSKLSEDKLLDYYQKRQLFRS